MFLLFTFLIQLHAEDACPMADKFHYRSIEMKLNLDGNTKPDVVAVFASGEGDAGCSRKAVVLDAPEKIGLPKEDQWLTSTYYSDPNLNLTAVTLEKRKVGDRDVLYYSEEIGDFASFAYYTAEAGKLKRALYFSNNRYNGHLTETYDLKKETLALRVFSEGELEADGTKVDLEFLAVKSRCRVRELYIQLKYLWDRKERKFKEVDQGCVMGSAID